MHPIDSHLPTLPLPAQAHPSVPGNGLGWSSLRSSEAALGDPALAAILGAALDEVDLALMVIEVPVGRLRHASRQAREDCASHGALEMHGQIVQAGDPAQQRTWQLALAATQQGRRSLLHLQGRVATPSASAAGSGTPIETAFQPETVTVALSPLPWLGERPLALAVFGRRQLADARAVSVHARLHGLTTAEEAVLQALCQGRKPVEIAADQGVAISTIRTHVHSIRLKTGAGSIREIAEQLARIPPLAAGPRTGPVPAGTTARRNDR